MFLLLFVCGNGVVFLSCHLSFYFIYDGNVARDRFNLSVDSSAMSSAFWMCIVLAYQLFALFLIIVFRRRYSRISRLLFFVSSILIFTFLILPTLSLIIVMIMDISKVF